MARGRMVAITVATDKRLNSLSEEAELVFLKTVPHLDRDGIIIGDPVLLAAQVCPRRPRLVAMIDEIIQEWIGAGLAISYIPGEDPLLFFPGFSKNQAGMRYEREPASPFPPPPGYCRTGKGLELILEEAGPLQQDGGDNPPESGKLPANFRQTSDSLPLEENRREEKVNRAPAHEDTRSNGVGPVTEPSVSSSPVDGLAMLMARGVERFEQNRRNGGVRSIGWQTELNKELAPAQRVPLVDSLAQACGLTAALDDDTILREVHEYAVKFYKAGFETPDAIQRLKSKWLGDSWRKDNCPMPSLIAFFRFASKETELAKTANAPPAARPAPKTVRIYNQYSGQYEDRIVA